jgi:hypothetical protein
MSVEIDSASRDIFLDSLAELPRETARLLESTTEKIYRDAYAVWPVRKPVATENLTDEGKVRIAARNIAKTNDNYNLKRALAASYKMQDLGILRTPEFRITSKGSKEKLYTEIEIKDDTVIAKVGNSAQYAWAIKVGAETNLPYPIGTRVSQVLLWEPAQDETDSVAQDLADITVNIASRT